MERFELKMDLGNAAFDDDGNYELARILREVATRLEDGTESGRIRDINGNTVGRYEVVTIKTMGEHEAENPDGF